MSTVYSEIGNNEMYAPVTNVENLAFVKKAQAGDESAQEQAVNHNLRLVLKMAHKYGHTPMSFDDRFQEGYKGLQYAITTFNPTLNDSFSMYAGWCICGHIIRHLHSQGNDIHIPMALRQRMGKVKKFCANYESEYGAEPSNAEICEELKLSELQLNRVRLAMSGNVISIHQDVGDDSSIENFIGSDLSLDGDVSETQVLDGYSSNPHEILWKTERMELVNKYINQLPETERFIIRQRMEGVKLEQVTTLLKTHLGIERTLQCVQQMETRGYNRIKELMEPHFQSKSKRK
jgi:RNA polymerase sigma factor (sigma-70 family)